MKYKLTKFTVPLYHHKIAVVITDDLNEYTNQYLDAKGEFKHSAALVCTLENSTPKQLDNCHTKAIFEIEKDPFRRDNLISHESYHVLRHISEFHGFGISDEGEETGAYLLGFLVEQFNKVYEKTWQNLTSPSTKHN